MSPSSDYTPHLRSLMQQTGIPSFNALSRMAGISKWQVEQLRNGKAAQMRVEPLHKLSQALQISLTELLETFSDLSTQSSQTQERSPHASEQDTTVVQLKIEQLKQEYQRLQAQLEQQRESLQQEFQQSSLQALESWLTYVPAIAHATQDNPQLPATKLLPFMRPIEQLLKSWGVEMIDPVDSEIPYDPHLHQLIQGTAQVGDRVKIRHPGYRQGDKLLYRAKVSPVGVGK
ncbi:MAG: nucleotide exchange factor GrpE [Cyanobacteria bacterium RU_5_0]|nr:nucleotide exchange factor GrpE [Cyanobacteria bacterium RU_5_0]